MPSNRHLTILLALAITFAPSAFGQSPPVLVEDLIEDPAESPIFRSFSLAVHGDEALFWGNDGRRGTELWITDGTVGGTRLWTEVCPGSCDFDLERQREFGALVFNGTRAFFAADDGVHGVELWTSDGTESGTHLVSDLCPGPCSSEILALSLVNDRAWFSIETPTTGREPWVSDGTPEGTLEVGNLNSGNLDSSPRHFLAFGDKVAFQAFSDPLGIEWWQSDGTLEGTQPLTDLCPGSCPAISNNPVSVDGSILFSVTDGTSESLYLLSPGSEPQKLSELCTTDCDSLISTLYPVGDRFYFQNGRELWSTDLTPQGTGLVAPLPSSSRLVRDLMALDDGTVLVNIDAFDAFVSSIYRLDGESFSTSLIHAEGLLNTASVGPYAMVINIYSQSNLAVYRTDGTAAGTVALGELSGGTFASNYSGDLVPLNGQVLAHAYTHDNRVGQELWTLDFEGPQLLLGATERPGTALPEDFSPLGSTLLYAAKDLDAFDAQELRAISLDSNGMGTSRSLMPEIGSESLTTVDLNVGPRALFGDVGDFFAARETWVTDGTEAGTELSLFNGSPISWPRDAQAFQGNLVFLGDQGDGQKIWIASDPSRPELLIDIHPDWTNVHVGCGVCSPPVPAGPVYPRDLTLIGSQGMAFVARQDASGAEVWFSDGTAQGTFLIADLFPGTLGSEPEDLISNGEYLFFNARGEDGYAWWSWSFGQEPTRLAESFETLATETMDGRAYWLERTADGFALSSSDGSDFHRIGLPEGVVPSDRLLQVAGKLFFVAADTDFGAELWTYDPAADEELRLRRQADLRAGELGSFPEALTVTSDALYFSADDGIHGREAWRFHPSLDTSPVRLTDLAPGSEPSSPRDFATLATQTGTEFLVFSADDGISGRELWSMSNASSDLCVDNEETLCLQNGRFQVTARWRVPSTGGTGTAKAVGQTDESGLFWFFGSDNYELVVKVLDGTSINGAFWFFYGALSDVEYWIDVQDLVTGTTKSWYNPPGQICGDADVLAFPEDPLAGSTGLTARVLELPTATDPTSDEKSISSHKDDDGSGCVPDAQSLCLLDRFQVTVDWVSEDGSGTGTASPGTPETGFFWFFDSGNTELVVKMLDGGSINGRFWFYYGALSDVEYTIRVHDTVTGQEAIYHNPQGQICGGADTDVFPNNGE